MSLQAGFSRVCITPPMGTELAGYFSTRYADGVLDDLYLNTIAFENDGKRAVLISADLIYIRTSVCDTYLDKIAEKFSLPREAIFIACTHIHTGPTFGYVEANYANGTPLFDEYMGVKLCDAVQLALNDLKPAKLSTGLGEAKGISFIRRYLMKDGTTKTNPGVGNPDIDHPLGTPNEEVRLVKVAREGGDDIYLVSFGVHPDVIGGTKITADWPGFTRTTVEKALDGVKCILFNGFQGDVNHINTAPLRGDWDVRRGYEHARRMGHTVAGAVLQICDCTVPVEGDAIRFGASVISMPTNQEPDMIELARETIEKQKASGQKVSAMQSTGMNAVRALRILALENGPDFLPSQLSAVAIGDVVFGGIQGEPFTEIGNRIRAASPFGMTVLCCCVNGGSTYYPTSSAYDEGGYEANTSRLKKGGDNIIVDGMNSLLAALKEQA